MINTIVPALFAYGWLRNEKACMEKALSWLRETACERNTMTRAWENLGIAHEHAADSQALIELKTRYCDRKNCLACRIGRVLLSKDL